MGDVAATDVARDLARGADIPAGGGGGRELVGRRCWQKNNEELESCGSAADFLLGEEMEGDSTGRMEVEAGAHPLKINDCNKCHLFPSIASPPAFNHDQADELEDPRKANSDYLSAKGGKYSWAQVSDAEKIACMGLKAVNDPVLSA